MEESRAAQVQQASEAMVERSRLSCTEKSKV
jgi:hypothetical protein